MLELKLYYATLSVKLRTNEAKKQGLLSSFRQVGINFSLDTDAHINGPEYISIGNNVRAFAHFRLQALPKLAEDGIVPNLQIGDNVTFEDFCHVGCVEKVTIGEGTLIASKVFISDHSHGQTDYIDDLKPADRKLISKPINIGKHCWIGDGACILPGVTLGNNVIVGANAVVTHSFPDNCVIAGVPAKIIKTLK